MAEISIALDKHSTEPLYLQLYLYIKHEIVNGNLKEKDKLPSKRQLAASAQCSLNTVQSAYNQLVDEGYIVAKQKSGYYVANVDRSFNTLDIKRNVPENSIEQKKYRFDFTQQGVDLNCFPFLLWRRVIKESVQQNDIDLLQTGDPQGLQQLRLNITRYLHQSRGVLCTPDQIVVSSGTEYLMQLIVQLFDRNTVYAIENPGYDKLSLLLRSNRVTFEPIGLDEYGMIPDELENSQATVAYVTPSHQYPTGNIMPLSRRMRLLQWAYKNPKNYIIEDDYDGEFRYSGKPIPALQGIDASEKVIYIGAFSKSLSPSMRISYMILPRSLVEIYRSHLNFYICPVPMIVQKALCQFMEAGYFERHLNRMRNLYRRKRENLITCIQKKLPDASIRGENAGLHFLLKVNNGMTEKELIEQAIANGVKISGLRQFYSGDTPKEQQDVMMIGFASINDDEIKEAVDLLQKSWYSKETSEDE
ncbi:MAG: GntR family transcriptional regulator [Clostridiales bacterium]|nr:GntR family transcriptional regulator [Clostridiales bacterium]